MVWWPSGSGHREIGDFPISESSVALTLFFWSGGLMVLATDKSATECLVNDSSVALM